MIRKMKREDREIFLSMTDLFYKSDAVLNDVPQKYHEDTFEEIMRSDVYLEGYIFEVEDRPAGYAITTKLFSHEAGGITLWIDEIFVLDEHRSQGLGKEFFEYIKLAIDTSIVRLRLEVESDNKRAKRLYENMGFKKLDYDQMFRDTGDC